MWTMPVTPELLAKSVIAVPPLARAMDGSVSVAENGKIIRSIESGGVNILLYGGNAVFYHLRLSEYETTLQTLVESASASTLVIPSVGPAFGTMMDQVSILKNYPFPTAMVLPQREIADEQGIATGIRKFAEAYGKPIVLYLKHDRWLSPSLVGKLVSDGLISWIKYAVVLADPSRDDYLRGVLDVAPADRVVSGIGEQPAIVHMRDFGVVGFTSGCVCVAPKLSMKMLHAIHSKDFIEAERIRECFKPLEDLRNAIQPIRVLHQAVRGAAIAETGPMTPMLGELSDDQTAIVHEAARGLRSLENA